MKEKHKYSSYLRTTLQSLITSQQGSGDISIKGFLALFVLVLAYITFPQDFNHFFHYIYNTFFHNLHNSFNHQTTTTATTTKSH